MLGKTLAVEYDYGCFSGYRPLPSSVRIGPSLRSVSFSVIAGVGNFFIRRAVCGKSKSFPGRIIRLGAYPGRGAAGVAAEM